MSRKIHLKRRKKRKKRNILISILTLLILSVLLTLHFFGKLVTPVLLNTSEVEIQKISALIANKAISKVVENDMNFQGLFETVTSSDGTIQTIDFNPTVVNQLLNQSTSIVLENLKKLENGTFDDELIAGGYFTDKQVKNLKKGIFQEIPVGLVTKNPLLSNLGPKIPIRIHYIGDVLGNITTEITSYGINNAMVCIGIHLELTAQILLPYLTEEKTISFDIPLSIKMIQGKIPTYYSGGINKDSPLYTLPID